MSESPPNIRAPLNPTVLVLASFVLSPMGAGIALAVNDSRLDAKERAPLTFYVFFFVALIGYLVVARLHVERTVSFGSRTGWLLARVLLGWVAVTLAYFWSRPMLPRYARVRAAGISAGRPLSVCAPALLASVALDIFVWQLFMRR